MTRFLAPLAGLWMALVLSLVLCLPAHAHAQLLSSAPASNAVLAEAPATLSLRFNEPVRPLAIGLIGPDGGSTDLTGAPSGADTLSVALPPGLATGTHVLNWRVVSADAHPIAGALLFSVGHMTGSGAVPVVAASPATAFLLWASKALLFAGLFLGLGGAVFALAVPLPRTVTRPVLALSALGLVMVPLSLGLQGADALGLSPGALLAAPAWAAGISTSYGLTALLLALALALGIAALALPRLALLALPGWGLAAIALAISGHAGAASPQWLTRSAVILHIAGILFWAGALLPLFALLRQADAVADRALARFSRLIPLAVLPIVVSGSVLAVIQLGPPGPSWLTRYGFILAAKLVLLAMLFGLALYNRVRLTGPVLAGAAVPRPRLRRSILLELVLVLAIFGLVALWRFSPPPRALAEAAAVQAALAEPLYLHAMNDAVMAHLTVTPGHAGPVGIEIFVMDEEGNWIEPQGIDVTLQSESLGVAPFKAKASPEEDVWMVRDLTIPLAGAWTFTLDIRLDRFRLQRIAIDADIP